MTTTPLAIELAELIRGHGVQATVTDGFVHVLDSGTWANLWMEPTPGGSFLLQLRATTRGQAIVADRWAGLGRGLDEARKDGLYSFCRGTFHVLLAALWGVLERDQVEHEVRVVDGKEWDLYLGGCTLRQSQGTAPLTLPLPAFEGAVTAFLNQLTGAEVHYARLFVAVVNGEVTREAVMNDAPNAALYSALDSPEWCHPKTGFSSLRWFIAASPRVDGPSHRSERTCHR